MTLQRSPASLSRFAALAMLVLATTSPLAAQWTQWGGENRDFRIRTENWLASWPEDGPRQVWKRTLGEGDSTILVDGDVLYTMYRDGGDEVVVAFRAEDGKTVWEHRYDAPVPEKLYVEYGDGPHATPAIAGDRICTVGISGILHCLDKAAGKALWSRDLVKEYGSRLPDCGYGSSPLVHGDRLIVAVGGKGHGMVAFRLADGEIAWRSSDFASGYAAPFLIDVDGQTQLLAFMREEVAGYDPESGELLWSHPHKTQYGVNASTPLWGDDGILFISSAYDQGSQGLRLSRKDGKARVEKLWAERKIQVHFSNAQRIGDHIYATSGDFGPVFLLAVEAATGKIAWQKRGIAAKASLLQVDDDMVLMVDEKGKLVVATVTPEDVEVHVEHQLVDGQRLWATPTLVDRRLYLRDTSHAYAFDLGGAPAQPASGAASAP